MRAQRHARHGRVHHPNASDSFATGLQVSPTTEQVAIPEVARSGGKVALGAEPRWAVTGKEGKNFISSTVL